MLKTSGELLKSHLINDLKLENNAMVWAHVGIQGLGILEKGLKTITSSFNQVLNKGSFIVPAFTYSWNDKKSFDKEKSTHKSLGVYSNHVISVKKFMRNSNPNFSVSILDNTSNKDISNSIIDKKTSITCFGYNSVFDIMYEYSKSYPAYILLIGGAHNDVIFRTTFLHYIEEKMNVPYRYNKKIYNPDNPNDNIVQSVRYLNGKEYEVINNSLPPNNWNFPIECKFNNMGNDIIKEKMIKVEKFQYSESRLVPIYDFCNWLEDKIKKDPYYLIY